MSANARMYGDVNVLVNAADGGGFAGSQHALHALLSSSSPVSFAGSRGGSNLDEVIGNMSKRPFYTTLEQEETLDEDLNDCIQPPEKKRRLTSEQVQFLERSFEVENKLEPDRKIQLARELGLQPRQVAVWFQNRRARWKTKQLERDYDTLKSCYENLRVDYDVLLKEKEKLLTEVTHLTGKLQSKEEAEPGQSKEMGFPEKKASSLIVESGEEYQEKAHVCLKEMAQSCKQEDRLSSAATDSSGVLDYDSSHLIDCGHSSLVNHPADHSDVSHTEEEDEEEGRDTRLLYQAYNLLKMEEENICADDAAVAAGVAAVAVAAAPPSCNEMFTMEENVPWWDLGMIN